MECLLSDYSASLNAIANIKLNDPGELFAAVPASHVNIFYHAAVSLIMTRRYSEAIDTLSGIISHISRVMKPGSTVLKTSVLSQHQKMLEKIMLLYALATTICPGHRLDDQVVDIVIAKCSDKLKRLQSGDVGSFEDIFESACPKFISPTASDVGTIQGGAFDAWRTQVHMFMIEAKQQIALMKLRSYLRLYSCIELGKLSRFNEMTEGELVSKLMAFSHKCRHSRSDVSHSICDGKLITTGNGESTAALSSTSERYFFISGIRTTSEHIADLDNIFRVLNAN
jgi:translation initiation factor 3 subunit L